MEAFMKPMVQNIRTKNVKLCKKISNIGPPGLVKKKKRFYSFFIVFFSGPGIGGSGGAKRETKKKRLPFSFIPDNPDFRPENIPKTIENLNVLVGFG